MTILDDLIEFDPFGSIIGVNIIIKLKKIDMIV